MDVVIGDDQAGGLRAIRGCRLRSIEFSTCAVQLIRPIDRGDDNVAQNGYTVAAISVRLRATAGGLEHRDVHNLTLTRHNIEVKPKDGRFCPLGEMDKTPLC